MTTLEKRQLETEKEERARLVAMVKMKLAEEEYFKRREAMRRANVFKSKVSVSKWVDDNIQLTMVLASPIALIVFSIGKALIS